MIWPFNRDRNHAAALERMRQSRDWWKTRALAAERQRDAAWELTSQQNRVIQDQGVELAKLREQLADAVAIQHDLARLQRRWNGHAARCAIAQQLDDVDRDKRLENSE